MASFSGRVDTGSLSSTKSARDPPSKLSPAACPGLGRLRGLAAHGPCAAFAARTDLSHGLTRCRDLDQQGESPINPPLQPAVQTTRAGGPTPAGARRRPSSSTPRRRSGGSHQPDDVDRAPEQTNCAPAAAARSLGGGDDEPELASVLPGLTTRGSVSSAHTSAPRFASVMLFNGGSTPLVPVHHRGDDRAASSGAGAGRQGQRNHT